MKHYITSLVGVACLLGIGAVHTASAQALRTAYFSDSYLYRHQMNPAFANTSGYVSVPMVGNVSADVGINRGVKDFIYHKKEGSGLTTFLNKQVSTSTFLDHVDRDVRMAGGVDLNIFSAGFDMAKGYTTFDIGLHAQGKARIDEDLFRFMKEMSPDCVYDISNTRVSGMGWMDIALGHSRTILDNLRVGVKVKWLLGLGYADLDMDGSRLKFGTDSWRMRMKGVGYVAAGGKFKVKESTNEINGYEDITADVHGSGVAFDLGAVYEVPFVSGLTISGAVTDIGWIKWDCVKGESTGEEFNFDGFTDVAIHDGEGSLNDQWKEIEADLEDMTRLYDAGEEKLRRALGATVTLGAEWELPIYRKISLGALYTQRISRSFGYVEGRLLLNYAPSKAFDLSFSACESSYGFTVGSMANLHLPGFNLFLGADRIYIGSYNGDHVPLNRGGMKLAMGLNIPFGF